MLSLSLSLSISSLCVCPCMHVCVICVSLSPQQSIFILTLLAHSHHADVVTSTPTSVSNPINIVSPSKSVCVCAVFYIVRAVPAVLMQCTGLSFTHNQLMVSTRENAHYRLVSELAVVVALSAHSPLAR